MAFQLFHITNDWGEALVLKSCLEFYGLDPVIQDYQQLALNPFKVLAFGGIRIHLPEDQLQLGADIRASQSEYALPDKAPVSKSLIGMKVRTFISACGWLLPFVVGFIAVLPPLLVALLWIALFPWLYFTLYWWLCAVIICIPLHAKYIALPRLRRRAA